jgi:hypothetical protein
MSTMIFSFVVLGITKISFHDICSYANDILEQKAQYRAKEQTSKQRMLLL